MGQIKGCISVGVKGRLSDYRTEFQSGILTYCGMVSKDVFSVLLQLHDCKGFNLYFPVNVVIINFKVFQIEIKDVTPYELTYISIRTDE